MTPQEFEYRQEWLELAYENRRITAGDFRTGMRALGFGDKCIDATLADLDGDDSLSDT